MDATLDRSSSSASRRTPYERAQRRCLPRGTILLAGAVAVALHATGRSSPQAMDDPIPAIPPKRAHHSLVFDAERGEVLLYGGSTAAADESSIFFDDLWSWDGARWRLLAKTSLPRSSHGLVCDPDRKRLLLLGGLSPEGPQRDVRVFDGKQFTPLEGTPDLALGEPNVVYDDQRKRVVLHGGIRGDGNASGETWELDGEKWKKVATDGPGALHAASMVYDEARGVTLLFGGRDGKGVASSQTWQWDGSEWSRVAADGPPARFAAGLAFDTEREQAVLFGGGRRGGTLADTWLWDGESWTEAAVAGPSGRYMPEMAWDAKRAVVVLFGGRIKYPDDSDETWEWDGERWSKR